jgi:hypothetical protein
MVPNPKPARALWMLAGILLVWGEPSAKEGSLDPAPSQGAKSAEKGPGMPEPVKPRSFRTFLPKPGESIDEPASQVVQVLLDRQDKGDFDSYMVQVLFRGKPAERSFRMLADRVEIDFYDTGKPSMRLSKIRGGAVEASALDEYYYHESSQGGKRASPQGKRMIRLTLYMHEKPDLKFRDTLDRTLIHFRLAKSASGKK